MQKTTIRCDAMICDAKCKCNVVAQCAMCTISLGPGESRPGRRVYCDISTVQLVSSARRFLGDLFPLESLSIQQRQLQLLQIVWLRVAHLNPLGPDAQDTSKRFYEQDQSTFNQTRSGLAGRIP